jgi:hypothetical protein
MERSHFSKSQLPTDPHETNLVLEGNFSWEYGVLMDVQVAVASLPRENPHFYERTFKALLDTGSTTSMVACGLARYLLYSHTREIMRGQPGRRKAKFYFIDLALLFPKGEGYIFYHTLVTDFPRPLMCPYHVIIGRDILQFADLEIFKDNRFRLVLKAPIDYPEASGENLARGGP